MQTKQLKKNSFSKFSFPQFSTFTSLAPTERMERSSLRGGAAWHAAT
jgi:hypothetical protein